MYISFQANQTKLSQDYYKLQSIVHSQDKTKKYLSKYPKQMFLRYIDSLLEFSSCPNDNQHQLAVEYTIKLDEVASSDVAVNKTNKAVLGLDLKNGVRIAIRFQKDEECRELEEKLQQHLKKCEQILKIGQEKNYLKLEENIFKIRTLIFLQKEEKKWIYEELCKRVPPENLQIESEYLLKWLCDDEPQMVQALMHQKGQSYEISYAISNIERKNQNEGEKKLVEDIVLEGYSRKKQLQGIMPEEELPFHDNPMEKEKREEEELFINSVGNFNFEDENIMRDEFEFTDLKMDRTEWIRKQKRKDECGRMKIPKKEYSLFHGRSIQYVEPGKNMNKKIMQDKKQKQKEEVQVSKKVVESAKLLYRMNRTKREEGLSWVSSYIDETRKILEDFYNKSSQYPRLQQFIKKTKENHLSELKY